MSSTATPLSTANAAAVLVAVATPHLSFFRKLQVKTESLFKAAPKFATLAYSTLVYLAPLVETTLVVEDPAVAAFVNPVIEEVKSDLGAAALVVNDAGTSPTFVTYLKSIQTNLQLVESTAALKDPATQAKFSASIGVILTDVQAILLAVPQAAPVEGTTAKAEPAVALTSAQVEAVNAESAPVALKG